MERYHFKVEPYAHQLAALKLSWKEPYYALFMDMGTGKSKVLIDNMAMLYDIGEIDAAIVIAPKGVYRMYQEKELPQHLPDHVANYIVAWDPRETIKKQEELESLFVQRDALTILLMNVEAFSTSKGVKFAERFLRCFRCLMAVDESTTIKNRTATRTRTITKLGRRAAYRRIMTGSPVTKSPLDLFTQCEFLQEGALGQSSYWAFQNRYAKLIRRTVGTHSFNQIVGYQNLEELHDIIRPYSYRIRKEECLDLPDKVFIQRTVELTPEQKQAYTTMRTAALAIIEGSVISAATVLTQLLRLQQVCSGYAHMDDGTYKELPTNKLDELLQVIEETDGKVIIWTNFTHDLKKIAEALTKSYGAESVATFWGGTPDEERQRVVARFQDEHSPLRFFVGQPRTGGFGLTLTAASTVIYYSNGFDLEVRLQSEDRAHRIGQQKTVVYVDIVVRDSVDEKILRALRSKIDIASAVLAEGHKKWLI